MVVGERRLPNLGENVEARGAHTYAITVDRVKGPRGAKVRKNHR